MPEESLLLAKLNLIEERLNITAESFLRSITDRIELSLMEADTYLSLFTGSYWPEKFNTEMAHVLEHCEKLDIALAQAVLALTALQFMQDTLGKGDVVSAIGDEANNFTV